MTDTNLDETTLAKHRDAALELAKRKPTGANLRALKKAETALNQYRIS